MRSNYDEEGNPANITQEIPLNPTLPNPRISHQEPRWPDAPSSDEVPPYETHDESDGIISVTRATHSQSPPSSYFNLQNSTPQAPVRYRDLPWYKRKSSWAMISIILLLLGAVLYLIDQTWRPAQIQSKPSPSTVTHTAVATETVTATPRAERTETPRGSVATKTAVPAPVSTDDYYYEPFVEEGQNFESPITLPDLPDINIDLEQEKEFIEDLIGDTASVVEDAWSSLTTQTQP